VVSSHDCVSPHNHSQSANTDQQSVSALLLHSKSPIRLREASGERVGPGVHKFRGKIHVSGPGVHHFAALRVPAVPCLAKAIPAMARLKPGFCAVVEKTTYNMFEEHRELNQAA
jgi:hypothetical protein